MNINISNRHNLFQIDIKGVEMQTYTLADILQNSKIKNANDLVENLDAIAELAKDDIARIAKAKKIFFSDFDFAYKSGIEMLKNTLQKSKIPRAAKKFLRCENIENAVKWLLARILNNMKNATTNPNYKTYCCPKFGEMNESIASSKNEFEELEMELELSKIDKQQIKNGLKKVWENAAFDMDFDLQDFELLCNRYGFKSSEILGYDPYELPVLKSEPTKSGHSQLVLFF
ncbi:MAG: hypothetical protein PHH92_10735 [Aliarcobacter skirrowii]|uniref:hypothetical protein n=1 Tax=Aliarcobacter skirrowii TaxID=28200 RepID=UPI00242EFA04|nr:hypothetical protein [Aliarcobacter skirrowii]MDD3497847.1 hypothetical protein [Aliarcobacter skirrowii]